MEKNQQSRETAAKPETEIKPLDKRFDVEGESTISPDILETFPYEYPHKDVVVEIETNEFTAVCPWSGLPDFGIVRVQYIPDKVCIELRSFKYYLLSYRNVGMYQEHVVNRILKDLVRASKPRWMQIMVDYNVRGGVHTVASVEWGKRK
jgi:7-cyano-7-deazaguanine reductase